GGGRWVSPAAALRGSTDGAARGDVRWAPDRGERGGRCPSRAGGGRRGPARPPGRSWCVGGRDRAPVGEPGRGKAPRLQSADPRGRGVRDRADGGALCRSV